MIRGRLLLSKKYRQKKDAANLCAKGQCKDGPLDGPVRLEGVAYWPDRRRRDLLFFAKALHDALEGVCYNDDSQIVEVSYRVGGLDKDNPRVELEVTAVGK